MKTEYMRILGFVYERNRIYEYKKKKNLKKKKKKIKDPRLTKRAINHVSVIFYAWEKAWKKIVVPFQETSLFFFFFFKVPLQSFKYKLSSENRQLMRVLEFAGLYSFIVLKRNT